ncbi:hypothetical protein LENED_009788 [Lentinula edodes]|uniref:Uncharacterized protein n=1 Tax=Lentinula edodes TaxID=5353 RepID=A0A1Q3EKR6_LENED|nr:hypothetical protein LENED_009788 [Lentinula edodes]
MTIILDIPNEYFPVQASTYDELAIRRPRNLFATTPFVRLNTLRSDDRQMHREHNCKVFKRDDKKGCFVVVRLII